MLDYNKLYTLRELCEVLGYKYDKSHSRRSLEEIQRSYEIDRVSPRKYRIVKEYTEDEKIQRWKSTEYKKLFKDVVYTVLSCSNTNSIWKSDDEYMSLFYMVNKNFHMFTRNYLCKQRDLFLEQNGKGVEFEADAMSFANEVRQMLKRILKDTFNQMEDDNLIMIEEHLIFGEIKYYKDEHGDRKRYTKPREATTDEKELLMETETKVLLENGYQCKSLSQVPNYYDKLRLRGEISNRMDIAYYTIQRELILNRYGINYEVEHNAELLELKRQLNKGTINKTLNSTQGKLKEIPSERKIEIVDMLIDIKSLNY